MPEPRERPVNLRPWQVRAALENRLSLLVAPMKLQPRPADLENRETGETGRFWVIDYEDPKKRAAWREGDPPYWTYCPLGQPGDRLYGREAWYCDDFECQSGPYLKPDSGTELLYYRATDSPDGKICEGFSLETFTPPWRSSTCMPRWASRIHFEVAEVRVARVQDVTEQEIWKAGLTVPIAAQVSGFSWSDLPDLFTAFRRVWEHEHPKVPYASDPWAWLVSVKPLEVAHAG